MAHFAEVVFNLPIDTRFTYSVDDTQRVEVGQRVRAPVRSRMNVGVVVNLTSSAPTSFQIKPIDTVIDPYPIYTEDLLNLGQWMAKYYCCSYGEALSTMTPSASAKEKERATPPPSSAREAFTPNEEQRVALQRILQTESSLLYLYGVTGSGKSELLLQVAQKYVQEKKGVIILMPEISLTFQMACSLSEHYEMPYAILHSRLRDSERVAEWMRIMRGEVHLVIGARSAVFAPLPNLDIIIIDEEQDGAYKSSSTPRYHTRHIAMRRARNHHARVLFSSATPSLEAWHHIARGNIEKISLTQRIEGATQPHIEVVPLQQEQRLIGAPLERAIIDTVRAKKQVILLHNRRGYGRALTCKKCGYTQMCPRCTVTMTYHQHSGRMICHYCAFQEDKREICPECRSLEINFAAFGTERVEQELRRLFPHFRVARIDTDVIRKREALSRFLTSFQKHEIDIVIGTQMIAKGHNFPNVELVGIILADTLLTLPDFRAEEQTFMLLTQVAGRAGRFSRNGRVLIQTYRPTNTAIQAVRTHDLVGYYQHELRQREQLLFPPYCRMIRIVTRSKSERNAERLATKFYDALLQNRPLPSQVYEPIPCVIAKIAHQYRYQVMVSDVAFSVAHRAVANALRAVPHITATYLEIDIDPTRVL